MEQLGHRRNLQAIGCEYPSSLPLYVTIIYMSLNVILLIFVVMKTFNEIKKDGNNKKKSTYKKISIFRKLYSIYAPLTGHLFDQASDIAVLIEFIVLYQNQNSINCTNVITEQAIKLEYFVAAIVISFNFYRIVSSIWIYYISRSCVRCLLQILDLEIFRTIYIAIKLNLKEQSEPQKFLSFMETLLEAVPQLLIQISFLIFTQTVNVTIVFSCIVSMIVILLKVTSDDSALFNERGGGDVFVFNRSEREWLCQDIIFVLRYVFRIFNVSGNILMYSLVWTFGFGYVVAGQLIAQFLLYAFLAVKKKDFRLLANIIFYSMSNAYSFYFTIMISTMNIVLLIMMLVINNHLTGLLIYTIVAVFLSLIIGSYFYCFFLENDIDDRYKAATEEGLLASHDLAGFTTLIFFGKGFGKSNTLWISKQDKVRQENWIHLAMDTDDDNTLEFAKYLIEQVKETDEELLQFKQAMQQKSSIGWMPLGHGIKFNKKKSLQLFVNNIGDREYWNELLTTKNKYGITPFSRIDDQETKSLFEEIEMTGRTEIVNQ